MFSFTLIYADNEYCDFELIERGKNAATRSIVLTLENGTPSYGVVRRSFDELSAFGEKAGFQLGARALAALTSLFNRYLTINPLQ